ncbi:MAG: hypothetical protein H8F28_06660 [Fibrella sp.]|nr:hypothetical protein [Armatimonadota bacterium]
MKLFRLTVTTALAALFVSANLFALPAIAQDKMGGKMDDKMGSSKMGGKMDKMAGPIYVSKSTKMGFTPAQAKKMAMKDMKGMKLVKMTKLPAGYKMSPPKMGDKMGNKMDDKMGGKMDDKMGGKP